MATKTTTRTTTQKKPVPAPVRPQSNAATKKPAPPSVKPQAAQKKKPVPPQVRPQSTARTNSGTVSKAPTKAASTTSKTPSQAGGLKAGQAIQSKPQAEQAPKADNWISRMVQGQVQRVGDYAGGYINNIGNGVNKIGEGIGGKYVSFYAALVSCVRLTMLQNHRSDAILGTGCLWIRQRHQGFCCSWRQPRCDSWKPARNGWPR